MKYCICFELVPATFNTIETWIDQEKAAMSVQQASK